LLDKDDDFGHVNTCVQGHQDEAQEGCLMPPWAFMTVFFLG